MNIPLYRDINECHEASGFPLRTDLPGFNVFTFDETYPCSRAAMPPHRRGFYQITFFESMSDGIVQLDGEAIKGGESVLLFSAPEQVLSWVCGGQREAGYMIYVNPEVLAAHGPALEEEFPFFALTNVNVLAVTTEEAARLKLQFERLRTLFHSPHPYRLPTLTALTRALLYDCRALHEHYNPPTAKSSNGGNLVTRFQQLVSQCFQQHCSVECYATALHVSVAHLSAMVKQRTGRTPRSFIDERVLLEAKRLLTYTGLNVSEVAEHLQFSEPTHFVRFFKRNAGTTPLRFRMQSVEGLFSAERKKPSDLLASA